jgi:hypothetical protein
MLKRVKTVGELKKILENIDDDTLLDLSATGYDEHNRLVKVATDSWNIADDEALPILVSLDRNKGRLSIDNENPKMMYCTYYEED